MARSIFEPCRGCACTALRKASRVVTQHYESYFRGSGLRVTQFTILSSLAQMEPQSISRLANFLGMERTTLTRNLGPLERRALVRFSSDDDGRVRRVTITPAGESVAKSALKVWKQAQSTVPAVLKRLGLNQQDIAAIA
jgi:DNA-binding MarR family transcriptional regulator